MPRLVPRPFRASCPLGCSASRSSPASTYKNGRLVSMSFAATALLEHLPDGPANYLYLRFLAFLAQLRECGQTGVALLHPLLGERAGLDVLQDDPHVLLDPCVDDLGSAGPSPVLRRVGDVVPHALDPALLDEVDDELELVEHLEVGYLGLVPGLDEDLERLLDEFARATAQVRLLPEQVRLGLLFEGRLYDALRGRAQALGHR